MGSERVASHLIPATEPLDIVALGEHEQEAVALADAAVTVLDGHMPPGLPRQVFMLEAEAYCAAVAGSYVRDLGNLRVGSVPAPDYCLAWFGLGLDGA